MQRCHHIIPALLEAPSLIFISYSISQLSHSFIWLFCGQILLMSYVLYILFFGSSCRLVALGLHNTLSPVLGLYFAIKVYSEAADKLNLSDLVALCCLT